MPYTITITRDEADLLNAAGIPGVTGGIFEFSPANAMDILGIVAQETEADAPGRQRLSDRLATLYGQHLAAVRKRASAQVAFDLDGPPNEAPMGTPVPVVTNDPEDFDLDPETGTFPILSEGVPDNDPQEPDAPIQVAKPTRKRRA